MGIFYKLNSGCTQIVKNDQTDVYILLMLMYQMISNVDIIISIIKKKEVQACLQGLFELNKGSIPSTALSEAALQVGCRDP